MFRLFFLREHPHFLSVGGRNRSYLLRSYWLNAEITERSTYTYGLFIWEVRLCFKILKIMLDFMFHWLFIISD